MTSSTLDKRDEFLLHMYDAFWNNVSRAENSAWTMVAVYGALIAGVGLARSVITSTGAAFVLIVFGYVGSCLSASANLWFRRNLTLIGRIETNFLRESDYGSLIPSQYKKSRRFWTIEYWTLLMVAYPFVSISLSLILLSPNASNETAGLIGLQPNDLIYLTALTGLGFTLLYVAIQHRHYISFLKRTA